MGLQLITAATPVLTPENVRLHCSIAPGETAFDPLLVDYIASATAMVEEITGRALGSQQWKLSLPAFSDTIVLPRGPVTGIVAITYADAAGADQALGMGAYLLDLASDPQAVIRPDGQAWPVTSAVPNAVRIIFTTGYAAPPAPIAQAIRATVASWFMTREATELPAGVMTLLEPYRAKWIFA